MMQEKCKWITMFSHILRQVFCIRVVFEDPVYLLHFYRMIDSFTIMIEYGEN